MKRLSVTSIFIFLITFGCQSEEMDIDHTANNQSNEYQEDTTRHLRYLALGDSYTIGHGVEEAERYPMQLADTLYKSGVEVDSIQIIARTGWTTDELMAAIEATELHPPFDLVTLLIGVNNQFRGRSPESYRPEFIALLQQAIEFAGGNTDKVIVLSIPDWGFTTFASGRDRERISAEIDQFNEINREESENFGVIWIDVTQISREGLNRPELIAQDGLHPSGIMYSYWVKDMYPHASQILTRE